MPALVIRFLQFIHLLICLFDGAGIILLAAILVEQRVVHNEFVQLGLSIIFPSSDAIDGEMIFGDGAELFIFSGSLHELAAGGEHHSLNMIVGLRGECALIEA